VRLGVAGWDDGDYVGAEILAHIDGTPFASVPVNPSDCSRAECRVRVPPPQDLAAGEHVATLLLLLVSATGDKDVAAEDSVAFILLDLPAQPPSGGESAPPSLPSASDPARPSSLDPPAAILFLSPAKNNTSFLDPRAVTLRFRVIHSKEEKVYARVVVSGNAVEAALRLTPAGDGMEGEVQLAMAAGVHTATVALVDRHAA